MYGKKFFAEHNISLKWIFVDNSFIFLVLLELKIMNKASVKIIE